MCRQIHRLSQVTSSTASVTASGVSGGAAKWGGSGTRQTRHCTKTQGQKMIVATEISVCTYFRVFSLENR